MATHVNPISTERKGEGFQQGPQESETAQVEARLLLIYDRRSRVKLYDAQGYIRTMQVQMRSIPLGSTLKRTRFAIIKPPARAKTVNT